HSFNTFIHPPDEGSSNTHLSLESMSSSGFRNLKCTNNGLTMVSVSVMVAGAKMVCTMNLCLLFSLGS
uniref:Uncharacterized protein n=1 Tax=Pygocentrus nattereri TaxID=42514 RepID=A0A3B4D5B3_PYGNA